MLIEWNDQISPAPQPIAIDRAALFGDGFFTTGVVKAGRLQLQEHHLRRIQDSAERLLFNKIDPEAITGLIDSACKKQPNSIIRINFSRQQSQRGYQVSQDSEIKITINLSPLPEAPSDSCGLIDSSIPVSVNPHLAGLKHLNRLDSVLAASQLKDANTESLMYSDNLLICGSKSNVFLYIDGLWLTPQLTLAGVEGIMRQTVLDAMDKNSQPYKITDIKRDQLAKVEAAFITNCVIGVLPVNHINGELVDTVKTNQLKQQLAL